ncbi:hypothetical protein FJZ17_00760 [Candidatus Pacearchaeota archaeon]|nr:hypothetical protein [Candidatus Pacearchaeota archaeon]
MRRLFGAGLGILLGLSTLAGAQTNSLPRILQEYNRPNVSHTIVTTNNPVKFNENGRDYTLEVLKVNREAERATIRLSTPGWRGPYVQEVKKGEDYTSSGLILRFFEFGDNGVVLMRAKSR